MCLNHNRVDYNKFVIQHFDSLINLEILSSINDGVLYIVDVSSLKSSKLYNCHIVKFL